MMKKHSATAYARSLAEKVDAVQNRRLIPFGYYGGKFSHLRWLLPLLPHCEHFCEPFGGSAVVLINRIPSPIETYNDLDSDLANFFEVLRSDKEELVEQLRLTPFSRAEFRGALLTDPALPKIERARRFFIRVRQTRLALAQTASEGRWAYCRETTRRGMSGSISRWFGSIDRLAEVSERLSRVQIENAPALEVLSRFDSKGTLFYLDPPYIHSSRRDSQAYAFEMQDQEHEALQASLSRLKGKAAISGYRGRLMDKLYRYWRRHDGPVKLCHSAKTNRQECLWTNF